MADEAKRASTNADKTITSVGTDVNRFTADTVPELQRLMGEIERARRVAAAPERKNRGQPRRPLARPAPGAAGPGRRESTMRMSINRRNAARRSRCRSLLCGRSRRSRRSRRRFRPTIRLTDDARQHSRARAGHRADPDRQPRARGGRLRQPQHHLSARSKPAGVLCAKRVDRYAGAHAHAAGDGQLERTGAFRAVVQSPQQRRRRPARRRKR